MFGWINDGLYSILNWIYSWVGNWGWAIVVFTVMVRLVLTPLDIKSRVSMRKTTKLQPKMQELQKKYANDKAKLNQKTSELYKKEHINPLSSCLPLLLTWPILIAVFGAMRTVANRELLEQVGQILTGDAAKVNLQQWLWIKNLWMPDNLFSPAYPDLNTLKAIGADQWLNWFHGLQESGLPQVLAEMNLTDASFSGDQFSTTLQAIIDAMKGMGFYSEALTTIPGYTIPLINWSVPHLPNGLMLLPVLSAVTQIVMTKIMSAGQPQQPAANGQPNTGKFMQWFFPIFSLVICFGYSAAFALYWVSGNIVSMGQTFAINKYLDNKEKKSAPVAGEGSVR